MDFDPAKDYYKTLGVSKDASQDDVKKAFRRNAMQYHPDRQSGKSDAERKDAEARFKEMNEAHEVLTDPEARRKYDMAREMAANGGFGRAGGFGRMHGFGGMGGFGRMHGFDPFDPFDGGGMDDYDSVKPKPSSASLRPERGQCAKASVSVSFEDAVHGVKDVPFRAEILKRCPECGGLGGDDDWEICPRCRGTGWLKSVRGMMTQISNCPDCMSSGWIRRGSCKRCGGNGVTPEVHDFTVTVPAGTTDGTLLRLAGAGHAGRFGGPPGDMVVAVRVAESDRFAVGPDGTSLYTVHTLSPMAAILGSEREEIATPWGMCETRIPGGCQDGTKVRLAGQGLPDRRDGGRTRGDLYAVIRISIPKEVSGRDRKKAEEFRKWYEEKSGLSAEVNADRQSDREYVEAVKARYGKDGR